MISGKIDTAYVKVWTLSGNVVTTTHCFLDNFWTIVILLQKQQKTKPLLNLCKTAIW